jgi:transposase
MYYAAEGDWLREQVALLAARLYGRSSERVVGEPSGQMNLFEVDEDEKGGADDENGGEAGDSPDHGDATRPARRRGRRRFPPHLPREQIICDIPDEDKVCACGALKHRIGQEILEQLDYVPAIARILQYIRPKYACRGCEGVEDADRPTVAIAPPVPQIIPRSIASPSLLAQAIVSKFADSLPFYRQEALFERLGIHIGRGTMCQWAQKVSQACKPLLELIYEEVRSGPHIHADETPLHVVEKPGKGPNQESYMWVFRGGQTDRPAIAFIYSPSRGEDVVQDFLLDYCGGVQTDGHQAYDYLDHRRGVVHFGCLAHVRRDFVDILKVVKNARAIRSGDSPPKSLAEEAVEQLRLVFAVDASAREKGLSPEKTVEVRRAHALPLLNDFKKWLDKHTREVPPKSLIGKAINYARNQWPRLIRYVDHGHARPDNNLAENAIRPFVIGRKNWLFSMTPEGATATAALYSLVETAKANGLDPFKYLRWIFERIPSARNPDDYRALLPQNIDRSLLGHSP